MSSGGKQKTRSPEILAKAALAGELSAFGLLVERFEGPLYNFLCTRCASPEDAEELTQEAFLRAWQRLHLYDDRWRFSTWLFTLAKRIAHSHYRRSRWEQPLEDDCELVAEQEMPHVALGRHEQRENLWSLAGRVLTADQRSALWLRYGEELSAREIARVLDKRETTVRVLLFRARARLSRHLSQTEDYSKIGASASPPVLVNGQAGESS